MSILVTGSAGFIGKRVVRLLRRHGLAVIECDVNEDITSAGFNPEASVAIHLAANKYATDAEVNPYEACTLNLEATEAVLSKVPKVVLASTCKAADPITCYGASKLICERMVLNAGGTVIRLVNVLGSSGSVTEIWDAVPKDEPLPVTDCLRMFIDPDAAAALLVKALDLPPGRYGPDTPHVYSMDEMARILHPGRPTVRARLRFGDRPAERLVNEYEQAIPYMGLRRIVDCWEPLEIPEETEVAA